MSLSAINFKDFIKLQRGFDLPKSKRVYGSYPIIASTSITDYHNEYKVDGECVITGRSGALGEVQYFNGKCWPLNTSLWVKDFKNNVPKYVYYFLKTIDLKRFNSGAGVPTLNRNDLDMLPIRIHKDIETQRKIAGILSAYDDLIENNNRRIKILEEMAGKLYKEWFVDFKFPNHENTKFVESELSLIPEGWEVGCIGDLNSVKGGYAFKSKDLHDIGDIGVIKIKNIQSGFVDIKETNFINEDIANKALRFELSSGDILIAMTGAQVGKVGIMPRTKKRCFLNQRVGKFVPNKDFIKNNQYISQFIKTENFQKQINNTAYGAAQPNISSAQIESLQLIIPDRDVLISYEEMLEPSLKQVELLIAKNENLRTTRDLLLPRLISGELSVEHLDDMEAAA